MPHPETDLAELLKKNGQLESEPEREAEPKRKSQVAASRQGKVVMQGHFSKAAHNQMRMLAIETDKSIQELMEDAVNALFTLHNKPPIA